MSETDLFGTTTEPLRRAQMPGIGSHHAPVKGETDEWLTPPDLLDRLGAFDLDPCSPGDRRPWDTARVHYDEHQNGLAQEWHGRVWCNPPYSDAATWLSRLANHGQGTALIFARTETAIWFDHVWPIASAILFIRGRLFFHHIDGRRAKHNSGAPSALIAYGDEDARVLSTQPVRGHYVDLR
jgi:hypothetical protein